jgi:hypothetical protein
MNKSTIKFLNFAMLSGTRTLLLIPVLLVGCGPTSNLNTLGSTPEVIVQGNDVRARSGDDVYFKGDVLTLVNSQAGMPQTAFTPKQTKSCFDQIYKESLKEFKNYEMRSDTEYFEFTGMGDNTAKENTFEVGVTLEQFKNIDYDSLKKFDEHASYLDSTALYLLKSGGEKYLLIVGHDRTTSGYGHLQSLHVLLPLHEKKPLIEFDSVTRDPRKVWFNHTGQMLYLTVDTKEHGAVRDTEKREIPLVVALRSEGKELAQFEFTCKNLMGTYDQ